MKRAWTTEAMHNIENNGESGNEDDLEMDVEQGIKEMRLAKTTAFNTLKS